jgi:predicted ATPase
MGFDLGGTRPQLEQLIERLKPMRPLLVLDNAEHLAGLGAWLQVLLRRCDGLKVLVTSRARLGIDGEWLQPLEGLPVPAADETEVEVVRLTQSGFEQCALGCIQTSTRGQTRWKSPR